MGKLAGDREQRAAQPRAFRVFYNYSICTSPGSSACKIDCYQTDTVKCIDANIGIGDTPSKSLIMTGLTAFSAAALRI